MEEWNVCFPLFSWNNGKEIEIINAFSENETNSPNAIYVNAICLSDENNLLRKEIRQLLIHSFNGIIIPRIEWFWLQNAWKIY